MALTDIAIQNAKPPGKARKLADGGGLYLLVASPGGKFWRQSYRFLGKQKTLALGPYLEVRRRKNSRSRMIRTFILSAVMFAIGISACAAQERSAGASQWGIYTPDMKFSDVFGRTAAIAKGGAVNSAPSLGDIITADDGASAFLRDGVNGLLASMKGGSGSCKDMSALKLPWVRIKSAETVAADEGTRAYCKVIGVIDKEITFEVDMPDAASWEICRMASSRWPCSGAMPRPPPIPAIRYLPMAAAHGPITIPND
jgi:hypothetical protein